MTTYQWVQTYGADPRLPRGTMVKLRFKGDPMNYDACLADNVVWAAVSAYQRVEAPAAQRDPHGRIAELQRWHAEACAEHDALDAEVKRLTAHVADLERLTADTGRKLQESRERVIELIAQADHQRRRFHDLAHAQMEHMVATHAGIKRGIELGDLPPDYYGRFGTTWAPAK